MARVVAESLAAAAMAAARRTVCNDWHCGARCLVGCLALDADDVKHYVGCPALVEYFAWLPL